MVTKSTNYSGRTIDLFIANDYKGEIDFVFSNKVITGINKLAQIFIIKFFTSFGSRYISKDGTTLLDNFYGSNIDQDLVSSYINLSIEEVSRYMREDQPEEYSDERLSYIKLNSVSIENTKLIANITIESEAGEDITFYLPINMY